MVSTMSFSKHVKSMFQSKVLYVTWHHKISGKSHLLVLRYRHFYTAKNKGNEKILTNIIKFISILQNCNPGMFGFILKLELQERGGCWNQLFNEMQLSTHFVVPGHIYTCIYTEKLISFCNYLHWHQGTIPLHLAASTGHSAVVGLLLSKSTTQLHVKDKRGRTGLHLAAANGHYDMVALLLGQGSDINTFDKVWKMMRSRISVVAGATGVGNFGTFIYLPVGMNEWMNK